MSHHRASDVTTAAQKSNVVLAAWFDLWCEIPLRRKSPDLILGGDGQTGGGPTDAHGLLKAAEAKTQSIIGLSNAEQLSCLIGTDNNAAIEAVEEFRQVLAV